MKCAIFWKARGACQNKNESTLIQINIKTKKFENINNNNNNTQNVFRPREADKFENATLPETPNDHRNVSAFEKFRSQNACFSSPLIAIGVLKFIQIDKRSG